MNHENEVFKVTDAAPVLAYDRARRLEKALGRSRVPRQSFQYPM